MIVKVCPTCKALHLGMETMCRVCKSEDLQIARRRLAPTSLKDPTDLIIIALSEYTTLPGSEIHRRVAYRIHDRTLLDSYLEQMLKDKLVELGNRVSRSRYGKALSPIKIYRLTPDGMKRALELFMRDSGFVSDALGDLNRREQTKTHKTREPERTILDVLEALPQMNSSEGLTKDLDI